MAFFPLHTFLAFLRWFLEICLFRSRLPVLLPPSIFRHFLFCLCLTDEVSSSPSGFCGPWSLFGSFWINAFLFSRILLLKCALQFPILFSFLFQNRQAPPPFTPNPPQVSDAFSSTSHCFRPPTVFFCGLSLLLLRVHCLIAFRLSLLATKFYGPIFPLVNCPPPPTLVPLLVVPLVLFRWFEIPRPFPFCTTPFFPLPVAGFLAFDWAHGSLPPASLSTPPPDPYNVGWSPPSLHFFFPPLGSPPLKTVGFSWFLLIVGSQSWVL